MRGTIAASVIGHRPVDARWLLKSSRAPRKWSRPRARCGALIASMDPVAAYNKFGKF